jgi:uncharacterized C2H2 Zn-finger protein
MTTTFRCTKCPKVFERELYLTRHLNRKIPCNRQLKCVRCNKDFKQLCNYKKHMSKKTPCEDTRASFEMQLQLEQAKIKQKELDLKLEEEKTKQLKITAKSSKRSNTTINITQNNIAQLNIKLENHFHDKINIGEGRALTFTDEELQETITKNTRKFLEYVFTTAYNNSDSNMTKYKCIIEHNKQLYAKIAGKVKAVAFSEIQNAILKDLGYICENARIKSDPLYKCKIMNNPVAVPLKKKQLTAYKEAPTFCKKSRNRNIFKNGLEAAVGSLDELVETD